MEIAPPIKSHPLSSDFSGFKDSIDGWIVHSLVEPEKREWRRGGKGRGLFLCLSCHAIHSSIEGIFLCIHWFLPTYLVPQVSINLLSISNSRDTNEPYSLLSPPPGSIEDYPIHQSLLLHRMDRGWNECLNVSEVGNRIWEIPSHYRIELNKIRHRVLGRANRGSTSGGEGTILWLHSLSTDLVALLIHLQRILLLYTFLCLTSWRRWMCTQDAHLLSP